MEYPKPHLIEFSKLGASDIGYISVNEKLTFIPFLVKRVFWTFYTPESIVRGRHAHKATEQVLIAVAGRIIVTTESASGHIETFVLEKPNVGVYVPPTHWHTMQYSHTAVQLALASTEYESADYLRDYEEFKKYWSGK